MIEIMNKYKTIHENKSDLEQFWIYKYSAVDLFPKQPTWVDIFNSLNDIIKNLPKHECVDGDLVDKDLIQSQDGKYIRLEDVLELFSREKE